MTADNCLHTSQRVPCRHTDRCPLNDPGFVRALEIYIHWPCGLACPTGKEIGGPEENAALEIAWCFPGTGWGEVIAGYFKSGRLNMFALGRVSSTDHRPELCRQLRKAHHRWFVNLSKPGARWQGTIWKD